jgi:ectoine hydroxylase-related dioxygenase (phytanoyl-CoA dioxygenase family)
VLFESTEYRFFNYKCISKSPRVGSVFRWHRDYPYVEHTTTNIITSMLCLDEMSHANGATVVLPGSHRVEQDQMSKADAEIDEADLPDQFERVTVCCPAGSAVLFHANIIHGGGANESPAPRRNLISIWTGPQNYPISPGRAAHQGLMPRSKDPARQRQTAMTRKKIEQLKQNA